MNPHRRLLSQHPLAQLAIAFSAGICVANYLPTTLTFSFVAGAAFTSLSFLAVKKKRNSLAGSFLLLAFFFAGEALAVLEKHAEPSSIAEIATGSSLTLTGVLDGPPEFARDRVYMSLRVERISRDDSEAIASGRVWLLAPFRIPANEAQFRALQLRYGTRVRVTTSLDHVGNYHNPGVSTLSEYLDRREYGATGIVRGPNSILRLEDTSVFKPLAWLYEWRQRLQREIDLRFTPETAGVLDAALLGNRYNLLRSASERFREGGTFHTKGQS